MNNLKKNLLSFRFAIIFFLSLNIIVFGIGTQSTSITKKEIFCCPECLTFLKRFIADPSNVGALAPSSVALASAITAGLDQSDLKTYLSGRHILEVGAGTGVFTEQIIGKMGPQDSLDVVELDETFYQKLVEKFGKHPQVSIYHCSITEFHPTQKYHYIISGLPFNAFPSGLVLDILNNYKSLIVPNGTISYFEYIAIPMIKMWGLSACSICSKSASIEKENYSQTLEHLKVFKTLFEATTENAVIANIPPARAIICHGFQNRI